MSYDDRLRSLAEVSSMYSVTNILKKDDQLKSLLIESTSFIEHSNIKIGERLWYIKRDLYSQCLCKNCGKPTKVDYKNNEIKFCCFSCNVKYVDPETGLTKAQLISLKTKETLSKVDSKTGLTGYQKSGIKSKIGNSKVDETGLTGYQKSSIKAKESNSKIDPETGLSGYQTGSIKTKDTLSKIDPETGLSGYQKLGIKSKIGNSKVDENGLTGYQKSRKHQNVTMSKVDSETGLTGLDIAIIKSKETMSKVDIETGLTGYQKSSLKFKETKSKIDPKTGLTGYQTTGLKIKETRDKIDSTTGLTSYQNGGLKAKETLSKIDPKTGLTGYQSSIIKVKNTMFKIDPKTGLTGYQTTGLKIKEVLSKVDPKTGLTGNQICGIKAKETMSKVNPETGLTGYQSNGIKAKETLSKIDSETRLTGYQRCEIIRRETMSKVDSETGLTGYQSNGIKAKETCFNKSYNNRVNNFMPGYKLLTSKSEYSISRLLKYSCNKCNTIRESYWPSIRCLKCYPYNRSIGENEVLEFCQTLSSNVQSNSRNIISPLELDIYLPNHNLAIEYNGIFWHSSYSVDSENSTRHLYKTEQCKSKDIQLFHIFENEWQDPQKQLIWKSIIRNKLGFSDRIFARKTKVTRITSKDTKEFLESNHLQGTCGSSVNLGLKLGDELVAIMTFGRSRYDKGVDWELLRYCGKLNTSVVGGASKLLAQFRIEYDGSIISYADKRRSNGNLYDRLGFELSHESSPNYWYYKDKGLESRIGYQKHKLKDKLKIFDDNLSESQNMYTNGYRKIYDCGNQVWKLKSNV